MENREEKVKVIYIEIELRPYSIVDLARLYKVDYRTMKRWIDNFKDEVGERIGRYYTIAQVKIIMNKLDFPGTIKFAA